jgi:alpha-glucosidase
VLLNCGSAPVDLPAGEVLMASGPVDGTLPADTAVWIR